MQTDKGEPLPENLFALYNQESGIEVQGGWIEQSRARTEDAPKKLTTRYLEFNTDKPYRIDADKIEALAIEMTVSNQRRYHYQIWANNEVTTPEAGKTTSSRKIYDGFSIDNKISIACPIEKGAQTRLWIEFKDSFENPMMFIGEAVYKVK